MNNDPKIFCIGLNKTGTSSLHHALKILGIKSIHFKNDIGENIKDMIAQNHDTNQYLLKGIEEYEAYLDWSHPSTNNLFKEFDKLHPGSKFIFTTRSMDSWLKSIEKHVKRTPNLKQLRKENPDNLWLSFDTEFWIKTYQSHHKDVYDYFKSREEDLLVFDITNGDRWEKLCDFLELDIPSVAFPEVNTAKSFSLIFRMKRKAKEIIQKILGQ